MMQFFKQLIDIHMMITNSLFRFSIPLFEEIGGGVRDEVLSVGHIYCYSIMFFSTVLMIMNLTGLTDTIKDTIIVNER